MRCEACGYQFLLASSTECPHCMDAREAIVPKMEWKTSREWAIEVEAQDRARGDTGFRTPEVTHANLDANAYTEPQDAAKRPFDKVAGIQATENPVECRQMPWPDPPSALQLNPLFLAIYEAIKTWDINVPAVYGGYCGATGNHAYAVYRAVTSLTPHDRDGAAGSIPIMDSTVGLKAANAHLTQRVAELEATPMIIKSLEGRVEELQSYSHAMAANLDERNAKDQETEAYQYLKQLFLHMAPQCCVLPDLLGVCTQVDNAIAGLKMDNAHLTRQLAAQALAHAEQMEGLKASRDTAIDGLQRAVVFGGKLQGDYQELERFSRARIVMNQSSCDEYDEMLAAKDARIAELDSELSTMRVTPATQPIDAQQTAADVKAAPERRPDGTLKPVARAWEAPRHGTDRRMVGQ